MTSLAAPKTTRRGAPHQQRSRETVELILRTAADLLEEVGFEKLSTNMICKRAQLTPPALYRYFPNKYAVLKELGERLMAAQNALIEAWDIDPTDLATIEVQMEAMLTATVQVTRETKAGGWIMRSLHATPILSDVRRDSHRQIAHLLTERLLQTWPNLNAADAYQANRLGVEMGYALVEMVIDEPDLNPSNLIRSTAAMLSSNLRNLLTP